MDRPGVYLVGQPSTRAARATFHQYAQQLASSDWHKQSGFIATSSTLVPYLPVRSNLFLNGTEHDLNLLPADMRNSMFLNQPSSQLHGIDILLVQLLREVLAGKQVVVAGTILDQLSGPEIRRLLNTARELCVHQAVTLVILTTNAALAATADYPVTGTPPLLVPRNVEA
ncbi:hypothetical protein FD19_GL000627 [Lacticaseibacillus thailandensis DSM 22698 = JCM 13996]|uniref:Uncharacterized protein n=2 Tax=Lacticaseibacillus thailandensis TaxID=381741 RepID=A0A0R2C963_9LACO|nr:hypothetical protein FD19_GL000627 [Lacticaseibacillus thailandensis DSM 22698 = JCM 13996]